MKKMIATLMIAAGAMLLAQEAPQQPPKPAGDHPQAGKHPARQINTAWQEKMLQDFIDQYDANKDGVLAPEEIAVAEKELNIEELQRKLRMSRILPLFKALDEDKDGKISGEEKEKMPQKIREAGRGPGMGPGMRPGMGPGARPEGRPPMRRGDAPRKGGKPAPDGKPAENTPPPAPPAEN